ncbi:MAG TPA: hypothetical protein VNK95_14050 [Caldilineaceae bacterium]|nr:hypothetical protein [Caldilineaceae bacterium]
MLLVVLLLGTGCVPAAGGAAPQPANRVVAVETVRPDELRADALMFSGGLEITDFMVQDGQLIANGLFTVTDFEGNNQTLPVSLPVKGMTADETCQVLTLALGPLNLDVLGILINADEVQLQVVANPEKGFFGELLCGIADAYNTANLELVAAMLNEVIQMFW